MEIRELKKEELLDLLELYHHLHDKDDPLPDQTAVNAVWRRIQADEGHKIFGVFTDNRLIASCVLVIIPNLTRSCRPYGLIENVVTHADFRRRNIGNALLKHALNVAWESNCYKVMLLTGRKNEGTYRFYESAGFDRNAKQAFLAKPGTKR